MDGPLPANEPRSCGMCADWECRGIWGSGLVS